MGCFFSIFRFGTYVVKETDNNGAPVVNAPEIRKHSSTPIASDIEAKPKQKLVKPWQSSKGDKHNVPKNAKQQEKTLYKTTFETQVDAPPPHPLEERFQDVQLDEIEVETNLFAPDVEDAVIKIQAGVRGYLARKQVKEFRNSANIDDTDDQVFEGPVVPPPKYFEDNQQTSSLSPLSDLAKWKKLSDHLEVKVSTNVEDVDIKLSQQQVATIADKLVDNVIPLKDSNNHKVIETYVCKENILDVESSDSPVVAIDRDVLSRQSNDDKVVEKVFNVLMAETEFEDMPVTRPQTLAIQLDNNKTLEDINNETNLLINDNIVADTTPESEVLAELNQILDNNEKNTKNNELNQEYKEVSVVETQDKPIDTKTPDNEAKVIERVSETTTQEIIRNSFKEFVKEMTTTTTSTTPQTETLIDNKKSVPVESQVISAPVIEPKVVEVIERKTDSKIFEEAVVQTIFDEETIKSQSQTQVFAIELFKNDVNEEQLEKVVTISAPEESKTNIEDRIYKTSVDEFVIKPVEPQPEPTIPQLIESSLSAETSADRPVVLEAEQKIEITAIESRKNSTDDIIDTDADEQQVILIDSELDSLARLEATEEEVFPTIPSPIIQIEEQNGRILDEEEAAIRIQAAFRGFQIRRSLSREASPNRSTNNHNDNTDSNNNNNIDLYNNNQSISDIIVDPELPSHESTDQLMVTDSRPTGQPLLVSTVANDGQLSASNEQINTSLEQLEDQLMQQLMSSTADEDSRNVRAISEETERLLASGEELSAPLLLQRIQQSVDKPLSEELVDTHPELAEFEQQITSTSGEVVEKPIIADDQPLIQKSDTIIVDLLSSTPPTQPSIGSLIDSSTQETTNNINELTESQQNSTQDLIDTQVIESNPVTKQTDDSVVPEVETLVCPPTPTTAEIQPEVSFVERREQPVLTKIYSSESEQESDVAIKVTINDSQTSLTPVIESSNKTTIDTTKADKTPKKSKSILKETDPQIHTNLIGGEEQQITSEDISSPDDDNPEFVGLGPNNPIPVRASSPNPFGKKRRRGKKGGQQRK